MENYEKNKIIDIIFYDTFYFKKTKIKKETRADKKEKTRIRMLTILNSIDKNLRKK